MNKCHFNGHTSRAVFIEYNGRLGLVRMDPQSHLFRSLIGLEEGPYCGIAVGRNEVSSFVRVKGNTAMIDEEKYSIEW